MEIPIRNVPHALGLIVSSLPQCKMIGNGGKCGSLAFLERRTMSLLEWRRDPVGQLKKYAELGKICVEEVGRFDDCDRVWAVIGIVLGSRAF